MNVISIVFNSLSCQINYWHVRSTYRYSVLHRIVNFNKSCLSKSFENDSSGTRATSLTKSSLPQSGLSVFKDPENHTTGVFGLTALEVMPPILIYKSRAKKEDSMKIQPNWIKN